INQGRPRQSGGRVVLQPPCHIPPAAAQRGRLGGEPRPAGSTALFAGVRRPLCPDPPQPGAPARRPSAQRTGSSLAAHGPAGLSSGLALPPPPPGSQFLSVSSGTDLVPGISASSWRPLPSAPCFALPLRGSPAAGGGEGRRREGRGGERRGPQGRSAPGGGGRPGFPAAAPAGVPRVPRGHLQPRVVSADFTSNLSPLEDSEDFRDRRDAAPGGCAGTSRARDGRPALLAAAAPTRDPATARGAAAQEQLVPSQRVARPVPRRPQHQAVQSSAEKRLALWQICEWMVKSVPCFTDEADSSSSAGRRNSRPHLLFLHSKLTGAQNEGTGKSARWMLDPEGGKGGRCLRTRAASTDNSKCAQSLSRAAANKASLQPSGAGWGPEPRTALEPNFPKGLQALALTATMTLIAGVHFALELAQMLVLLMGDFHPL
uniref:Fork-head domain-containing protein n=1 Tax=Papio anubis TaxID=9555 RepID=A0A8I5NUG6_PAPAN